MDRETDKDSIEELQWVLTRELQNEAVRHLFGTKKRTFREERGFLGIIYQGSGKLRKSLFLRRIVLPEKGWVTWTRNGLMFKPRYFSKALDEVSSCPAGAGLIIVHSHFGGSAGKPPKPSSPDLEAERKLLYYLSLTLPANSPIAAGIVDSAGQWRIRQYYWPKLNANVSAPGISSGSYLEATSVRIVGRAEMTVDYYNCKTALNKAAVDSTIHLWGEAGQQILENLRVGIAGVGGLGSILTEYIARLGVGKLVLVDFDVVKKENLNRLIGIEKSELGAPKIKYAARIARRGATASEFSIRTFRGSVSEEEGLKHLLDSDVILNAADSPLARQVLDHAAYAYMIPVIDGGTVLIVDSSSGKISGKCQVSSSGLGQPCLECTGSYSIDEATMARENPKMQGHKAYVTVDGKQDVQTPRAPSVINYNGLVASLMIQRLQSLVLGFPPRDKMGQQRYYIELGELQWGPITECKAGCEKKTWVGFGDSHPVPIGVDPVWKEMQEQETSATSPRSRKLDI